MTLTAELDKSKYGDRLMIESEEFGNVAYEVKGGAICVTIVQNGVTKRIPMKLGEMKRLGGEFIRISEMWDGVRT